METGRLGNGRFTEHLSQRINADAWLSCEAWARWAESTIAAGGGRDQWIPMPRPVPAGGEGGKDHQGQRR